MKKSRKRSRLSASQKALLRVIDMHGSENSLAKKLGVAQQTINNWLDRGIPPHRVLGIEKASNGAVTRHELRPDIYPKSL
jgi:DNA-binding transcriptional regulator YdaS (Cro superfamily)